MLAKMFAVAALTFGAAVASAETPTVIMWDDLVPKGAPIENPFLELDEDTRFDLGVVAGGRLDLEMGFIDEGSDDHKMIQEVEQKLALAGVNVDDMMQAAADLDAEIMRRGYDTVTELDGSVVRMPGYALPLEGTDGAITEFLLVPYVGACIHVPAPPPNQVVYVEVENSYNPQSLYDPVWITGQIKIQSASRSLTFIDGTTDVPTGYTIKALSIEPYQ